MGALYFDGITIRLQGRLGIGDTIDELREIAKQYEKDFDRKINSFGEGRFIMLAIDVAAREAYPLQLKDIGKIQFYTDDTETYRVLNEAIPKGASLDNYLIVIAEDDKTRVSIETIGMEVYDLEVDIMDARIVARMLSRVRLKAQPKVH